LSGFDCDETETGKTNMTAHIIDVILREGFLRPIGHLMALAAATSFCCVDRE
jgi:hypothetical protein